MTYSVEDIRRRYSVSEGTVLTWIKNGELKAVDISRNPGGRPRWRITGNALIDFEKARTSGTPAPTPRKKRQPAGTIQFYK